MNNGSKRQNSIFKDRWSSKLIFILACIGSAVGLGNYWRFPYVTGSNGGGAFLLVYLICMVLFGIPLMLLEISVGKRFRTFVYNVLKRFRKGELVIIPMLMTFMILSFYTVLIGWLLSYSGYSIIGIMSNIKIPNFSVYTNTYQGLGSFIAVIIFTGLPVYFGISGIEKFIKYSIPLIVVITTLLLIYVLQLPNADLGLEFYLKPDLSKLADLDTWLIAISQVIFSLSVGAGVILTYSAYSKRSNIVKDTLSIVGIDLAIAVMAGLLIFPAVFSFGLQPGEGPSLMFSSLPYIFNKVMFGSLLGFLFYFILSLAGLTSSISLLEYQVTNLRSMIKIKRTKAVILFCILIFLIGLPVALSFSPLRLKFMGKTLLDWYDRLFITTTAPFAILVTLSIALMWKKKEFVKTLVDNSELSEKTASLIVNWICYIIPIIVLILTYQSISGLIIFITG